MSKSGLGRFTDRNTIRFDLWYPHPPAAVWRAITDFEALATWFLPWEMDLRPGGKVLLWESRAAAEKQGGERPPTGTITALEPESLLEISFAQAGPKSWPEGFVRFELSPGSGGCAVVFMQRVAPDHVWFEPEGQIGGPGTIHPGACAGWQGMLQEDLTLFLDGQPVPKGDSRTDALTRERTERYREMTLAELT